MTWTQWSHGVQELTERFLSWRKRRRLIRKEKLKRKNPILDWLEAILSAVLIVLVINQYLIQAYQIPSQSMITTLEIGDRIFVNKLLYGPELVPGLMKIRGFREPRRGEIVIFENPSYIPIGPVKDILQRIVYMLTLSLVDIDRDEFGQPKHKFLIKRAVGMPGDRLRLERGDFEILLPGMNRWLTEEEIQRTLGLSYELRREFFLQDYSDFRKAGAALALLDAGLELTEEQRRAVFRFFSVTRNEDGSVSWRQRALVDNAYLDASRFRTSYAVRPHSRLAQDQWQREQGWYIPQGRVFPLGDNRDDSRDARYFGSVHLDKVLGRALFRYWPLARFGIVR